MEGLVDGCAPKGGACLDVVAVPQGLAGWGFGWPEVCTNHEVLKVLWSAVGNQGPLGDVFFRRLEACSTGKLKITSTQ